ncbi:hypothetical protein, partial [Bacillus thuringiensis]|uniref:hypothetical protein n=1 Tax=Bacillus thuringiensis TaxID=1428 RepID=UPI00119F1C90
MKKEVYENLCGEQVEGFEFVCKEEKEFVGDYGEVGFLEGGLWEEEREVEGRERGLKVEKWLLEEVV